jgi:hypothetical protein
VANNVKVKHKKAAIDMYNAILLKDKFKLPNIGKFKLKRFLISNWSRGEIKFVFKMLLFVNKIRLLIEW